jgi:hypothetical protein
MLLQWLVGVNELSRKVLDCILEVCVGVRECVYVHVCGLWWCVCTRPGPLKQAHVRAFSKPMNERAPMHRREYAYSRAHASAVVVQRTHISFQTWLLLAHFQPPSPRSAGVRARACSRAPLSCPTTSFTTRPCRRCTRRRSCGTSSRGAPLRRSESHRHPPYVYCISYIASVVAKGSILLGAVKELGGSVPLHQGKVLGDKLIVSEVNYFGRRQNNCQKYGPRATSCALDGTPTANLPQRRAGRSACRSKRHSQACQITRQCSLQRTSPCCLLHWHCAVQHF